MYALSHFSCVWLFDSMDCSLPSSSVHGISQARILEWVAMPSSKGSSQPRDRTHVSFLSCTGKQVLYRWYHLGSPDLQVSPHKPFCSWCGTPSDMAIRMPGWAQLLITELIISESKSCVFPFCFSLPLRKDHVIPSSTGSKVCRMSLVPGVGMLNL